MSSIHEYNFEAGMEDLQPLIVRQYDEPQGRLSIPDSFQYQADMAKYTKPCYNNASEHGNIIRLESQTQIGAMTTWSWCQLAGVLCRPPG